MKKYSDGKRIEYVDIAKGLLIYLVFFGHLVHRSIPSTIVFSFHMPAFFFLSGYVATDRQNISMKYYVIKRFIQYIVPFSLFCMLGIAYRYLSGYSFSNSDFWWRLVYLGQPKDIFSGSGWFLWALFWGDIIFYIYSKYFMNSSFFIKGIGISLIYFIAINILDLIGVFHVNRLPLKMDSAFMAAFFIIIGNFARKNQIIESMGKNKILHFLLFIFLTISVSVVNGWANIANCQYLNPIMYLIASVSGCISVLIVALVMQKLPLLSHFLGGAGRCTLAMFMLEGWIAFFLDNKFMVSRSGTIVAKSLIVGMAYYFIVLPFAIPANIGLKKLTTILIKKIAVMIED